MYLLVNNDQYITLQSINSNHNDRQIIPKKSNNNNWIIDNDPSTDCENPGDTWYDWKDWLHSLEPTDDIPQPPPPKRIPERKK
jgi:hypothetical protein